MVAFIICIFLKLNEKRFFSWCNVGALHKCLENIILLLKDFASLFVVYVFVCGKNIYIGHDTKADDNMALTVTIIVISIRAIQHISFAFLANIHTFIIDPEKPGIFCPIQSINEHFHL